jgi:tetratricopeptide (TPR) repeat protein
MSALAPPVHLMENHDEAYHVWRRAGARDRILVHIDAHHDMWWMKDPRHLSIANFVCPALTEGIVREVFWIVPERSVATIANRAGIERHVAEIVAGYPGKPTAIQTSEAGIRTAVLGRPLTVCTLGALPPVAEPVLLDIDTDYLVIPKVTYGKPGARPALPWRWPADLVSRLRQRGLVADVATIAYSVDGGYTPIAWKYLGDELAHRLRSPEYAGGAGADGTLEAYALMKAGAIAQQRGDDASAEAAFLRAGDRIGAAPFFRLAYVLARQGRTAEAREAHARAVAMDPSYRRAFATPGIPLYCAGRYAAAERAFSDTLQLDPSDASALVGLAWMAARRRQWVAAAGHARTAIATDCGLLDAHRMLAEALDRTGQFAEAIRAYEQSLKLALRGHRLFNGVIATNPDEERLLDADHARTHARLARLYERVGQTARAIAGYRIAAAGGYHDATSQSRLERLQAAAPHASSHHS